MKLASKVAPLAKTNNVDDYAMTDYMLHCSYEGYDRASESPVYDSGNYVMGVHRASDTTYCYAVRMTQRLYNVLQTKLEEYNAEH